MGFVMIKTLYLRAANSSDVAQRIGREKIGISFGSGNMSGEAFAKAVKANENKHSDRGTRFGWAEMTQMGIPKRITLSSEPVEVLCLPGDRIKAVSCWIEVYMSTGSAPRKIGGSYVGFRIDDIREGDTFVVEASLSRENYLKNNPSGSAHNG